MTNINQADNFRDDDINLAKIIQTLIRHKILIFSFTFLTTFAFIAHSYTRKEVFKGTFNILVKTDNKSESNLSLTNSILNNGLGLPGFKSSNETQRLILSSPLVLKPVYQYVKSYYEKDGLETKGLTFKSWLNNELDITFEKGSNVLSIEYINKDKKLILNVLNSISKKYKDYSRFEREKNLNKTIEYLKTQRKIIKSKYEESQKKLNEFSIKYGLGDLDGFVGLGQPRNSPMNKRILSSQADLLNHSSNNSAGQRYNNQFQMLQDYEARYIDLSSKLKPESKTLKSIKLKIDNLKSLLKRPNEILIKYKQLTQNALRDESLLDKVERSLEITKLEKIKTPDSWVIISEPTINSGRVSPKRKEIAIISFITSFILSSTFAIYKDKKSGILYSLDEIKLIMKSDPDEIIYDSNPELSILTIKNLINKDNKFGVNEEIGFIEYKSNLKNNILDLILSNKILNASLIDISDREKIDSISRIFIVTKEGELKKEDYSFLNQYISSLSNKSAKWLYQVKDFN